MIERRKKKGTLVEKKIKMKWEKIQTK